jgi:hypothetical protein
LQSDPMQANRETKSADRGDPTGAAKHDAMLITTLFDVNERCNAKTLAGFLRRGFR